MKDNRPYLNDLLEYLQAVEAFPRDGRDAFMSDLKTQLAVIRAYEVVGEIAKRLSGTLRDANPQIDWRKLIGFRDFLAHNYEEIILEFVWEAVEDLPNLRTLFETLLASLPEDELPD